ncbi:unnamed protein product [Paramecium octaurelia]|uniref:Protein kinase domain-containing protein n=1 Tax=Paramecium octaurelia TaxID=43137 RepID=A0A8S1XK73_PAROT|nr:unnamed protein product [Paramecium octaurelia]
MENRFTKVGDQQTNKSCRLNKFVNDSSYSQFNFTTQNPIFMEGELIDAGSFGQVYMVQDNRTGKIYAVKKINLKRDFDQEDLQENKSQEYNKICLESRERRLQVLIT